MIVRPEEVTESAGMCQQLPATIGPLTYKALSRAPLVTVIVANYNYGRYLLNAFESLKDQTYTNWELIVCDDGSTDESPKVLCELAATDDRVKAVFKQNGGHSSAWNLAYEHSRGELIAFLDADDWFRADKIEHVIKAFRERPEVGLVHHQLQYTDKDGVPIKPPHPKLLPSGWLFDTVIQRAGEGFPPSTAVTLRRELASLIFPIPEAVTVGDVYVGMTAAVLTEIAAIYEPLTYYRVHEENVSQLSALEPLRVRSIDLWIETFLTTFPHYQQFVSAYYGKDVAGRLRLNESPLLSKYLPASYILNDRPAAGVHGFTEEHILDLYRSSPRKYVWKFLFLIPSPVSKLCLNVLVRAAQMLRELRRLSSNA